MKEWNTGDMPARRIVIMVILCAVLMAIHLTWAIGLYSMRQEDRSWLISDEVTFLAPAVVSAVGFGITVTRGRVKGLGWYRILAVCTGSAVFAFVVSGIGFFVCFNIWGS